MLSDNQLALRRTGITATDIRAIVGIDPYGRSAHDVWIEKVFGSERKPPTEAQELGLLIEPIVIAKVAAYRGRFILPVAPTDLTRVHPEHARHIATPDAFLGSDSTYRTGAVALAQVKVVSPFHAKEWGKTGTNEIPEWCVVQVHWEQHVCRVPLSFVGALIWPNVRHYTVDANEEMQALLVEEVERFWTDHVLTQKPPAIDGSEGSARMLKKLFPESHGVRVRADEQTEAIARSFWDTKRDLAYAEKQHETAKQLLIGACADFDGIDGDGWRLNYKNRKAYDVNPTPYSVAAHRHFDMRSK